MITNPPDLPGWQGLSFWRQGWPQVAAALAADSRQVLPPEPLRFAALRALRPDQVRVVILGQDPYPTPGHAHGHAFSTAPDVRPLPRSLSNIFKEMQADIGSAPSTGDLRAWAAQGVLLLNTALTVPAGEAGGHARIGWRALTAEILASLAASGPRAFVLWGKPAQKLGAEAITGPGHRILRAAHPSPLSAARGFYGSRPFSTINTWLAARGAAPVDWTGALPLRPGSG